MKIKNFKLVFLTSFLLSSAVFAATEWFSINNMSGECELTNGPVEMIKISQKLGKSYEADDTIENGQIVETTVYFPSVNASVTWYRTKDRCEQVLSQKKNAQQIELNKYQ